VVFPSSPPMFQCSRLDPRAALETFAERLHFPLPVWGAEIQRKRAPECVRSIILPLFLRIKSPQVRFDPPLFSKEYRFLVTNVNLPALILTIYPLEPSSSLRPSP